MREMRNRAIFLSLLVCLLGSQLACSPPKVSERFIEDVIVASVGFDRKWEVANLYPGSFDSSSYSGTALTATEEELVRGMLKGHYSYRSAYKGDKATIVVDISDTGVVEWINVNKLRLIPAYEFEDKSVIRIYLRYKHGRWWLVDQFPHSKGEKVPGYEDWPVVQ